MVTWPKLLKFVSAKYNIGFFTFIFPFDAKIMLLTVKNDFFPYKANFEMRQTLADVSFSTIACIEVLFINKHKGNVKHFEQFLCDKKTT